MKKKFTVEFTYLDGTKENVELVTEDIQWTIDQWSRNRAISKYEILNEDQSNNKQMLFG